MEKKKKSKNKGRLKGFLLSMSFVLLGMVCGILITVSGGVFDTVKGEVSLSSFLVLFAALSPFGRSLYLDVRLFHLSYHTAAPSSPVKFLCCSTGAAISFPITCIVIMKFSLTIICG